MLNSTFIFCFPRRHLHLTTHKKDLISERAAIPAALSPQDVGTSQLSDFCNLAAAVELCSDKLSTKEKSSSLNFPLTVCCLSVEGSQDLPVNLPMIRSCLSFSGICSRAICTIPVCAYYMKPGVYLG